MITILMASYNGEQYIKEQIDSLRSQTEQRFHLVISDDGSTDETLKILAEYGEKYPSKISVVSNSGPHGAKHNFMQLMIQYKDDYIMLCDQDDVWLDTKVANTMNAMLQAEAKYGKNIPILVHTDLHVVDRTLNTLDTSFRNAMNADYDRTSLRDQIIQNTLTGCTAMFNRSLSELIRVQPDYCVMHDWWIMLIASAFGKICPLYEQTILYRQHGSNEIGSKRVKSASYLFNRLFMGSKDIRRALDETYVQAQSFLDIYRAELTHEQKKFIEDYVNIPKYGKIKRVREMRRLHIRKNGFFRQLGQLLFG